MASMPPLIMHIVHIEYIDLRPSVNTCAQPKPSTPTSPLIAHQVSEADRTAANLFFKASKHHSTTAQALRIQRDALESLADEHSVLARTNQQEAENLLIGKSRYL